MGMGPIAQGGAGGGEQRSLDRSWTNTIDAVTRRVVRFKGSNFVEFRLEAMLHSTQEGIDALVRWAQEHRHSIDPKTDPEGGRLMLNNQLCWIFAGKTRGRRSTWSSMSRAGGTTQMHGAKGAGCS